MTTTSTRRRPLRQASENLAPLTQSWVATPIGPLILAASARGLHSVRFTDLSDASDAAVKLGNPAPASGAPGASHIRQASAQIEAYFAGELTRFKLPLDPAGTPFQRTVWRALARVPSGRTVSYAQLAQRAGYPEAARAVGSAMGANPLPVVVPCHRVLRSDGSLGGFGGGLWRKRFLLEHEQELGPSRRTNNARSRHTVVA